MNVDAARSRLLEAQKLLLDAQSELSSYHGEPSPEARAIADDRMREAMREIARARNELRPAELEPPITEARVECF